GRAWNPGYLTAEMPHLCLAAVPRRGPLRRLSTLPTLGVYLGFAGLLGYLSALNPYSALAYAQRGWAAYERGAYDEAVTEYTAALGVDPKLAWAYNGRGSALGMKGQPGEALADFTEAIRLAPRVADFYANRGWAHNLRQEFAEAARDCDRALQLNPSCA